MAMKAIFALATSETPTSLSAIVFATPAMSSGESSFVKASLNVSAAVLRLVAIAPAASCGKRGNALAARHWRFQRYVRATSDHSVSRWPEKNVRAMSGSPANFCPV